MGAARGRTYRICLAICRLKINTSGPQFIINVRLTRLSKGTPCAPICVHTKVGTRTIYGAAPCRWIESSKMRDYNRVLVTK